MFSRRIRSCVSALLIATVGFPTEAEEQAGRGAGDEGLFQVNEALVPLFPYPEFSEPNGSWYEGTLIRLDDPPADGSTIDIRWADLPALSGRQFQVITNRVQSEEPMMPEAAPDGLISMGPNGVTVLVGDRLEVFPYSSRDDVSCFAATPLRAGACLSFIWVRGFASPMLAYVQDGKAVAFAYTANSGIQFTEAPEPLAEPALEIGTAYEQLGSNFEFAGKVTQLSIGDYSVRIWNDGEIIYIDYPELSCGGTATLIRQTETVIELDETIDRGTSSCGGGGHIALTQLESDLWLYSWSSSDGSAPIVEGSLTLSLSDPLPSTEQQVDAESAVSEDVETRQEHASSAEQEHDFQALGRIGPAEHLVVITVVDNVAYVDYPELGCSGDLIVPDHVDEILPHLVEWNAVSFNEIVHGNDCPTGGRMSIKGWDAEQTRWIIERAGGTTGASPWQGDTELQIGEVSRPVGHGSNPAVPPGTVVGNLVLGLYLGKGPTMSGIGPTSEVLLVTPDSTAARSGIEAGDILLIVDNGAGEPAAHQNMMMRALGQRGSVELHLLKPNGNRVVTTIFAQAEILQAPSITPTDGLINDVSEVLATGRFSGDQPALDQLSLFARYLDFEDSEISAAIFSGNFNPYFDDLLSAYRELDGPDCEALFEQRESELRAGGGLSEDSIKTMVLYLRASPEINCRILTLNIDKQRIDAWNARFGPRPAVLQTARADPTIVAYYAANEMTGTDYAQRRCDFTSAMDNAISSQTVAIDCGNLRPSAAQNLIQRQLGLAQRGDVFGPVGSVYGMRLRLLADGSFEALDQLIVDDVNQVSTELGPIGALLTVVAPEVLETIKTAGENARYAGLMSVYIMLRMDSLGDCGEPTTPMTQTTTFVTEYYNGLGHYRGSGTPQTNVENFRVRRGFGPMIEASGSNDVSRQAYQELGPVVASLGCDNQFRLQLEHNMLAYFNSQPPTFVALD